MFSSVFVWVSDVDAWDHVGLQASSRFGEPPPDQVVGWIFSAQQECEGLLPTIRYTRTFKGVPVGFFFTWVGSTTN